MRWIYIYFVMCSWVMAQDAAVSSGASALENLQATHQASLADLDAPMLAWKERYVVELNKLKAKAQTAGDLNQVILIGEEIEAVADDGAATIDPKFSALKRLRGIYDQRSAAIEKARQTQMRTVLGAHRGALADLQGRLTKSGQIDQALAVRDAVAELELEMKAFAAAAKAGQPRRPIRMSGNRRPGRLVVFGSNSSAGRMAVPEDMQNQPYVKVSASYDEWYAITPDGQLICGSRARGDLKVPEDIDKPVVDHVGGRHQGFAIHADGTFSLIGGGDHTKMVPEGMERVRSISAGHSLNVAVLPNGRAVPFGYHLSGASRYVNSRNILNDVVEAAACSHHFYLLKRDGKVVTSRLTGEAISDFPAWEDVVSIKSGVSGHGVIAQLKDRTLVEKGAPDIPKDLGPVRQYRVGYALGAAQLDDGRWVVFGSEPLATNINQFLQQAGPLKDLSVGSSYIVGLK